MTRPPAWGPPPKDLRIAEDEVHVWRASLDLPAEAVARLTRTLSPDEAARAARFHFKRHRRRFTVARGVLRNLLALYLHREPDALPLVRGAQGKPGLAEAWGDFDLRFNVAHSGEIALFALARGREVGVDLERIRPMPDAGKLAARFFSVPEKEALARLPAAEQEAAFFRCWVQKEAFIKATGRGLSQGLSGFAVAVLPAEPASLRFVEGDPAEPGRWSLTFLDPGRGYVAALAVEGQDWRLKCRQWAPAL